MMGYIYSVGMDKSMSPYAEVDQDPLGNEIPEVNRQFGVTSLDVV